MRHLFLMGVVFAFLFSACGKKDDVKLELFSTDAFAFDIGDNWEVNASTRVKGFMQEETNGKFRASLAYELDLIRPNGETIKSIINKVEDRNESERMSDTPIEAQFELDSTYTTGEYRIVFNVRDALSGKKASSSIKFQLIKD